MEHRNERASELRLPVAKDLVMTTAEPNFLEDSASNSHMLPEQSRPSDSQYLH
jgi:hypothetical protein